jgi:HAD superfamily hydrolase (TIGR01549 family)
VPPPVEALALDLWNTLTGCVYPTNPMRRLLEAVAQAGGGDPVRIVSECTMLRPLPGIAAALRAIEGRLRAPVLRGQERARFIQLWKRAAACNCVFDDVEPALRRLSRRFRLGVISNTQSFDMEFWLRSGARRLLQVEILSFEAGRLKPDPPLFGRFAEALGIEPGRILMIGDNSRDDIEGARRAGFQALRIARPLPILSHREPAGEDAPVADLAELEKRLDAGGPGRTRRTRNPRGAARGARSASGEGGRRGVRAARPGGAGRSGARPRRARAARRRRR